MAILTICAEMIVTVEILEMPLGSGIFTCHGLRECVSVVVRVSQHGVRLHRVSHFTLAYVFTH